MKKTFKRTSAFVCAMAVMAAPMTFSSFVANADGETVTSDYTLTIPATLAVENSGWNALEGGISAKGTLESGKKLVVTPTSENSWNLVANKGEETESKVGYNLATTGDNTSVYSATAEVPTWEFTELTADGTSQTAGIIVENYDTKPAGDYSDTVTFTAKVETAKTAAETPNIAQADCTFSPSNGKSTLSNANITTAMEYSADNGTTWTDVTSAGSIASLAAGTVQIRVKETADKLASEAVSITVPEVLHFELVGPYTGDRLTCEYCAGETWQALVDRYDLIKAYRGHPAFGSDGFIYDEGGNWFAVTDLIDNTKTYEVQ